MPSISKTIDPPPAKPYRRHLLATWSDEDLIRRMSRGRSAFDFEQTSSQARHRAGGISRQANSKTAALALVKANSSEETSAAKYQDAVDDRDGARPPETGTLAVSVSSSCCYNVVDAYYFLRIDPEESYLRLRPHLGRRSGLLQLCLDQPAFYLRSCKLLLRRCQAPGGCGVVAGLARAAGGQQQRRDFRGHEFHGGWHRDGDSQAAMPREVVWIERTAILWSSRCPSD